VSPLPLQVCTFADNRVQILRCAMCDAVRGTSWAYFRTTQAEASELALDVGIEPGETNGKASIQKGDQLQLNMESLEPLPDMLPHLQLMPFADQPTEGRHGLTGRRAQSGRKGIERFLL